MKKSIYAMLAVVLGFAIINGCGKNPLPTEPRQDQVNALRVPIDPVPAFTPTPLPITPLPTPVSTPVGEELLAVSPNGMVKVYRYFTANHQIQGIHVRNKSNVLQGEYLLDYGTSIVSVKFQAIANHFAMLTSYVCPSNGLAHAVYIFDQTGVLFSSFKSVSTDAHNGLYLQISNYTVNKFYVNITYKKWVAYLGSGLNYWIWSLGAPETKSITIPLLNGGLE